MVGYIYAKLSQLQHCCFQFFFKQKVMSIDEPLVDESMDESELSISSRFIIWLKIFFFTILVKLVRAQLNGEKQIAQRYCQHK